MCEIIVSVCIITYNHGSYIEKALQGVLSQKLNCKMEIIIGEDCSTDGTANVCNKYHQLYPHKIKLLQYESNIGMKNNCITTIKSATRKYIAICGGDDYWEDDMKLQKQIEFLNKNKDYSLCIH